jgi:flagellar biosynthesis/type III secretory pathway protein FliH
MEKQNVSTRSMEEQEYLEKYVALSLRCFPIVKEFGDRLNEAMKELETPEEKAEKEREAKRIREFVDRNRKHELEKKYTQGYSDGWKDAEETKYVFFDVKGDSPRESISFSAKKNMTKDEFRAKLADWGTYV